MQTRNQHLFSKYSVKHIKPPVTCSCFFLQDKSAYFYSIEYFSIGLNNQNHMNKNFVNTDSLLQGPLGFHFKAQLLPYCVKLK